MANPEHVKIVMAGKEAIDKWWEENPDAPYTPGEYEERFPIDEDEREDVGYESEYDEPGKVSLDLSGAGFGGLNLKDVSLKGANLYRSFFENMQLWNVNFEGAFLGRANFERSYITLSNLKGTNLTETNFAGARIFDTDFSGARLFWTNFGMARLRKVIFNGIYMAQPALDGWSLIEPICTHFYSISFDRKGGISSSTRIPRKGYLADGEFEDRFKSRPTIEFLFEEGMGALAPAILGAAIDKANSEHSDAELRLLSIDARGGIPRAIIEIAEKISSKDAIALVEACYQQKFEQLQSEIGGLKEDKQSLLQITQNKMLLPAMDAQPVGKRPKGVLNEQVDQLLKSSLPNIEAKEVAKTLNKTYAGVYTDTSRDSVLKCDAWKNRKALKKEREK